MNYQQASAIALQLEKRLLPYCQKLTVVCPGSTNQEISAIKLICLPKRIEVETAPSWRDPAGLLKRATLEQFVHPQFVHMLYQLGKFTKGRPESEYVQMILHEGIILDLYMPSSLQSYDRQLANHEHVDPTTLDPQTAYTLILKPEDNNNND